MDLEKLKARASIIRTVRDFFCEKNFLELDTPALSPYLIPESCLEVFKTEFVEPWNGKTQELYLVPSPEIYMKKIIAEHACDIFQISKCYRNVESRGAIHNPEFTMLEYYKMNATYTDSAALTEQLFSRLDVPDVLKPPFIRLTMDEAFLTHAGFRLSDTPESALLAEHARRLGITESQNDPFSARTWADLYELIFVHAVEPNLPREKPVLLMNYPAQVSCLAKDALPDPARTDQTALWKQRWELYADGIELANCYSEETDPLKVQDYFRREGSLKKEKSRVQHGTDPDYWKIFAGFPECSGTAMGLDRLIALITGSRTIESVMPFPL
jgi:lysyl-tRNA synthetase class 2